VEKELRLIPGGLFSTGELADSLAVTPPLLHQALDYFESQRNQFLMLLTKSSNITPLLMRRPSPQVIVSFSVNSLPAWKAFEIGTPGPDKRLAAARELMEKGWRIRFRIDPIILQTKLKYYETICKSIAAMKPEMITIGTLRQFAGLSRFSKDAPRQGLRMSDDGRLRYPSEVRKSTYLQIADWLGFQPALCKETKDLWNSLGWEFTGCNCTI
jgi:spore photoproduct lyase